ncbi:hypothetical protein FACS1894216_12950 [Synergistales bacterium]|nr:hypothetical protein FACS1894216_12950 [Synergistales bacterium]
MLKMLNAFTDEIDSAEDAIADVLSQIKPEENLLKNSAGIISCHRDFVDSGLIEEFCARMSFDIIGITTLASGTSGAYGEESLTLSVLTSDDVSFSAVMSEPLSRGNITKPLGDAYSAARAALPEDPKLIIAFCPVLSDVSGAVILDALDEVCGGIPIVGGLTNDHTVKYDRSCVIKNGESRRDCAAMVLVQGNVNPRFFVTSIPEKNVQKQRAVITDSDGCVLKRVNDMPLLDYLTTIGLKKTGEAASSLPFLVDYGGGTRPVALGIYSFFPNGDALYGGNMPVGATFSVGMFSQDGIMETAEKTLSAMLNEKDVNGFFFFPCMSRCFMLNPSSSAEYDKISSMISDPIPFHFVYMGGEISPLYDDDGKTHNRFHNYTFVGCVL